mgnify:CR=1 FL=1
MKAIAKEGKTFAGAVTILHKKNLITEKQKIILAQYDNLVFNDSSSETILSNINILEQQVKDSHELADKEKEELYTFNLALIQAISCPSRGVLESREKVLSKNHPDLKETLLGLINIYLIKDDALKAEQYFEQIFSLAESIKVCCPILLLAVEQSTKMVANKKRIAFTVFFYNPNNSTIRSSSFS